jgi:hypothetical protein
MNFIHAQFQYTEAEAIRATVEVTNALNFYIRFIPWFGAPMLLVIGAYAISHGLHETPMHLTAFLISSI